MSKIYEQNAQLKDNSPLIAHGKRKLWTRKNYFICFVATICALVAIVTPISIWASSKVSTVNVISRTSASPQNQSKFTNPLPILATMEMSHTESGIDFYKIDMVEIDHDFGVDVICTYDDGTTAPCQTKSRMYSYQGTYPARTFHAQKDKPVHVEWDHKVPGPLHIFTESMDRNKHICSGDVENCTTKNGNEVRFVPHLHGSNSPDHSDGYPNAWFTAGHEEYGDEIFGRRSTYTYPNTQNASTLWLHDHATGITRLNAYAGLIGMYIITDDFERDLIAQNNIPGEDVTIALILEDKAFTNTGKLHYPVRHWINNITNDPFVTMYEDLYNDYIVVNGKVWPYLDVEPRAYRFRVLNGADCRYFNLTLVHNNSVPVTIIHIGGDGGFLPVPINTTHFLIGPAERADIVVDFSGLKPGTVLTLTNSANRFYDYPNNTNPSYPEFDGLVMQFKVISANISDIQPIHIPVYFHEPISLPNASKIRQVSLYNIVGGDEYSRVLHQLGTLEKGPLFFDDPCTENIIVNEVEEWEIINFITIAHTIHIHQVQFEIIKREAITFSDNRRNVTSRKDIPLIPQENGLKDTVNINSYEAVTVRLKFDRPGRFVWHCHLLTHEDYDMMRPIVVREVSDYRQ